MVHYSDSLGVHFEKLGDDYCILTPPGTKVKSDHVKYCWLFNNVIYVSMHIRIYD